MSPHLARFLPGSLKRPQRVWSPGVGAGGGGDGREQVATPAPEGAPA